MPANVTVVSGAEQIDYYLGNYTYANIVASMEPLKMKLATDTNQICFKNAAGTTYVLANETAITGTQYYIPRWSTTKAFDNSPLLCASDNSAIRLADDIKLTFGTDIDSSIKDDNTNMIFTRETSGDFVFSNGHMLINTTTDVGTARAVILDGTGNNQLALAFSTTKYLSVYVDGSSNTYLAPEGSTSAVFGGTGWFSFGTTTRVSAEKMIVQDNTGNYQLILANSVSKYTGLYVGAAGEFHIQPNGSGAVLVNASGNLSINNTNDTYRLDVTGTGRFQGTAGNPLNTGSTQTNLGLRVWSDDTYDWAIDMGTRNNGSNEICCWLDCVRVDDLSAHATLSINPFGGTVNIGTGTTQTESGAGYSLVTGSGIWAKGDATKIMMGAVDTDYTIQWDGSDAVHTIVAGDFVFTGGNVGVGTAAPASRMHAYIEDAVTDAVTTVLTLQHMSTGTVTDNSFGVGLKMIYEESSGHALGRDIDIDAKYDGLHLDNYGSPCSVYAGDYYHTGNKVVGARVVDARIDDAINSGDATTDGVIDALRDWAIAWGAMAAA